MGFFMLQDDIFVPQMLDFLNLRFGPTSQEQDHFGGIKELAQLQRSFGVFREDRSFKDSVTLLNLGGFLNPRARNRWYRYLGTLSRYTSNVGADGNAAIVSTIIENFDGPCSPVHFKAHDMREADGERVLIERDAQTIFYLEQRYLTISLPMKPHDPSAAPPD